MKSKFSPARVALCTALVAALLASSGCSWFRGRSGYELAPENRPLEIPPDLDRPASDPGMLIPDVAANPRLPARGAAVTGQAFVIRDAGESAWRRLGLALDRIDGVTINERAELLSVYNVSYEGETFLVKLAPSGDSSRISAISPDGAEITTGAAGRLLALLKHRLT